MTIKTISFHQRSTGMTGQVLASPEIERKLSKVEALYEQYHGVKMGRYKLYRQVLEWTREAKRDSGGYIQYTAEAVAGIVLDKMHKELGKGVRRKNREAIALEFGMYEISNIRDLARGKRGRKAKAA